MILTTASFVEEMFDFSLLPIGIETGVPGSDKLKKEAGITSIDVLFIILSLIIIFFILKCYNNRSSI